MDTEMNVDEILDNLEFPDIETLKKYDDYRYDNDFHEKVLGRLSNQDYYEPFRKTIGRQYEIQDYLLKYLFKLTPNNKKQLSDEAIKFLRIKLLNEFYSTNVPDICIYFITERIYGNENLLQKIENPQSIADKKEAVDTISKILSKEYEKNKPQNEDEKKHPSVAKEIYSFATKFCYFSNPNDFSIYDRYVAQLLRDYVIKHFDAFQDVLQNHGIEKIQSTCLLTKMKDYQFFMECLEIFMKKCNLPQENQQEYRRLVDNYLWLAGMMKYRKDSKVKDMYTKPKKAKQSAA
jgi:hypothetical protein